MSAIDPNLIPEPGQDLSGPQQALLRLVVDCMAEAVVVADASGRVVLANATARRLLALGRDEALPADWALVRGRYLADGVTPVPRERLLVTRALAGEQVDDELFVFRPPGVAPGAWMSGNARPIQAADGAVLGCVVVWRDISRQHEAEEATRNIASFPLDNPSPVMRVDRGGALLFANPASESLLAQWGCALGEPVPAQLREAVQAALGDGGVREIEMESGGRDISFDLAPFPDRGYVNMYGRDVTALRQAEAGTRERLRLQEQVAKTAATVPGVICSFQLTPDGRTSFPYASPAIAEIYGLSPEELARDASPIFQLMHPDDAAHVRDSVAASARTMTAWRDEFRVRHPAKGEIWVEGHSMPQLEADGAVLWHGYIQDVSERKRAEQALRESEARFRQLAESLPQLVWTCTAEGACDYLSPQWVAYTGIPDAPQLGDGWLRQLYPDDRRRVMDAWNRGAPAGRSYDIEFRIRRGDGAYRWFRTRASPLCDEAGNVVKWFGTNTDIDDLKQAEEALRQANENLERRVAERTTELQASALALRQSTDQLQRLSAHLESVREDQNARIAREVHDELGGTLTMLKLGLALALEQCSGAAGVEKQIRTMIEHADQAIRAIKRISTNLRPPMLDTLGLLATIGWYAADFSRTTGIRTETRLPKSISLPPERATAVFRIVQEALTNVARHAQAAAAQIVLRKSRGRLIVEIGDDGMGPPGSGAPTGDGLGIIGMQERARLLGGTLRMLPRQPRGTTLRLDIPLERR